MHIILAFGNTARAESSSGLDAGAYCCGVMTMWHHGGGMGAGVLFSHHKAVAASPTRAEARLMELCMTLRGKCGIRARLRRLFI